MESEHEKTVSRGSRTDARLSKTELCTAWAFVRHRALLLQREMGVRVHISKGCRDFYMKKMRIPGRAIQATPSLPKGVPLRPFRHRPLA